VRNLTAYLTETVEKATGRAFPHHSTKVAVGHATPAAAATGADYQTGVAFGVSKTLKLPLPQVAQHIAAQIQADPLIEQAGVATGTGFINLRLRTSALIEQVVVYAEQGISASPCRHVKALVDFASPNMCKALHVGHLRSIVLGDALSRILEDAGYEVARISHAGDWGTPVAMVLALMFRLRPSSVFTADGTSDASALPDPQQLDSWYVSAKRLFDSDGVFRGETYDALRRLHAGDAAVRAVWCRLCEASRRGFEQAR
jgi:arginyl-tRNA synthetase